MSLKNESGGCTGHIHVAQVIAGWERANVKTPAFLYDQVGIPVEAMVEHTFFNDMQDAEAYASSLVTPTEAPDALAIKDIKVELS